MNARQAIQQALKQTQAPIVVTAVDDDLIGELQVAEYMIFLLSLDTYIRYVEEATNQEDPTDKVIERGLRILRQADGGLDKIRTFLDDCLPSATHKRMLVKYLRQRVSDSAGVGRRAFGLRTLMTRGGASTMRAIFKSNRALKQIKAAIAASMMDDADAALDLFAALPMQIAPIRAWIDLAADTAGSGEVVDSPVQAGINEATDAAPAMLMSQVEEQASTAAADIREAQEQQTERVVEVEQAATEAARITMARAGEDDAPITKSEVIGVATAVAAAVAADPTNPANIPASLKDTRLDPEQLAAALTDGRVLVAAGAGAGKSTTLVARIKHLVQDRGVAPSRIMATSFSSDSAAELKEKVSEKIGKDIASQMNNGNSRWTLHSTFKKVILEHGTPAEKEAMKGDPSKAASAAARTVQRLWEVCFDNDRIPDAERRPTPGKKEMERYKTQWAGNNISPAEAMAKASSRKEADAAQWYEMYEGVKGAIPGWRPPCPSQAAGTIMGPFNSRHRKGGKRLGDFDDMLGVAHRILKEKPGVRKTLQRQFDHVLVDECQDLNLVQNELFEMLTENIDTSKGQSIWMVGDDKQSIYGFRGARPDIFINRADKEDWTLRPMSTNYRCAPEHVEAANKLIAHNENQIPMPARPSPHKSRGTGSLKVDTSSDEATAALSVIEEIKLAAASEQSSDEEKLKYYGSNAVLSRTNAELHAYETACIIRGVPYGRKGSSSFFGSRETTAVLGYVQLLTGDDPVKMQAALGSVIDTPNRFFAGKAAKDRVQDAIRTYARATGKYIKDINPMEALRSGHFRDILAEKLVPYNARGRDFKVRKALENLSFLLEDLDDIQLEMADSPGYTTQHMFDDIMAISGRTSQVDPATGRMRYVDTTLGNELSIQLRDSKDENEDGEEEDADKPVGNIAFLYALAKADPTDPEDLENDPASPMGFKAKMERYAQRMRDLRIDLSKYTGPIEDLPGVYLGTAHSVKGLEWPNTFVNMPAGKFPLQLRVDPEDPPSVEEMGQHMEDERRLAYVALTRSQKNMTIVCPKTVGGREAGISSFVDEAGLSVGENVLAAGTVEAIEAEADEVMNKEASVEVEGAYEGPPDLRPEDIALLESQSPWKSEGVE